MLSSVMRWCLAALLVTVASSACSGTDRLNAVAKGAADGGETAADALASSDVGLGVPCSAPPDQRPDGGTCVLQANGHVQDLTGAPLANLVMTFCGSVCYGARSDGAGVFTIPIGDFFATEDYALHADGRPDHAVDYLRLTHGEPTVITANMRLPTLPPSLVLLPADGAPASTITQGDLTLEIAAGTVFNLDIEDFGNGAAGRTMRVASVSLSSAPPYALAANVDAIYALAPSGAKSSNKMGVSLKNSAGLPASTAVDLLVLGDDYFSTPPNVGVLAVAAFAHVSADGLTIQTDLGEGISELTWLGVHRKGP